MKKWLRIVLLCVLFCLSAMLSGCGKSADLYALGLKMTVQMEELIKSDSYAELYLNFGISLDSARREFIANDYDTPTDVYSISMPDEKKILDRIGSIPEEEWNDLSDTVKEQILNRLSMQTIVNYANGQNSGDIYFITANCLAVKQFKGYSLGRELAYLYVFETGKPVIVIFTASVNGIQATAQFLITEKTNSLSSLRELFEPFGCTVNSRRLGK